jgi:hypothetical protein
MIANASMRTAAVIFNARNRNNPSPATAIGIRRLGGMYPMTLRIPPPLEYMGPKSTIRVMMKVRIRLSKLQCPSLDKLMSNSFAPGSPLLRSCLRMYHRMRGVARPVCFLKAGLLKTSAVAFAISQEQVFSYLQCTAAWRTCSDRSPLLRLSIRSSRNGHFAFGFVFRMDS